jgi:hypothetical protein
MSARNTRRSGDNARLSPAKPYRDTAEVVAGVARIMRAVGKRIATEDPSDLEHLQTLETELAAIWAAAIAGQRASGFSDTEIGEALGVTKQAVQKRWPRDVPNHSDGTPEGCSSVAVIRAIRLQNGQFP